MTKVCPRRIVWLISIASFVFLGAGDSEESIKPLLLALVILLPAAKVSGWVVEKFGQPAVLGELLAGLGVILLLFEVGLDSSLADLLKVGLSSLLVAIVGVILPFGLGWLVSSL